MSLFDESTEWDGAESGDGWTGAICGFCPTQGEGAIDGMRWYYRSRHERWTFGIADTSKDAIAVAMEMKSGFFQCGDMGDSVEEAWTIVKTCFDKWRATRPA